ncbi:hypothetical protein HU200_033259 [Digitaria exilis]|uniref:Uncharacterized protein n=1 Tax=Digitaria exilis TaxID=1010633 RepID=A0A835BJI3_9POAL|nr:hypothetical protein HU200_033259 [Digitaria exilis]
MAPPMYGFGSSNSHLADDAYTYQLLLGHALQPPNVTPHVWSVDETRHVMVPAEYTFADDDTGLVSYNYMDDTQANFINSPPELSLAMGTGGGGGNFVSATPPPPPPAAAAAGGHGAPERRQRQGDYRAAALHQRHGRYAAAPIGKQTYFQASSRSTL